MDRIEGISPNNEPIPSQIQHKSEGIKLELPLTGGKEVPRGEELRQRMQENNTLIGRIILGSGNPEIEVIRNIALGLEGGERSS